MNQLTRIAAVFLLASPLLVQAQAPREQALFEAVDRAESKHEYDGRGGREFGHDRGDRHHRSRGESAHHRGRGKPREHRYDPRAPRYGHRGHPNRHWISEYEARRLAARHYNLGIRSARFHDGLWTLIGHRHGHGSIRVVLDGFSGHVVGYFPLHPHRGWRW